MRRLEKTRRLRQIGQLRAKARPVTRPDLPFASRCFDRYPARIGNGLFDTATAEAAWTKFNCYGHVSQGPHRRGPPSCRITSPSISYHGIWR